ncbi:DUF192 domain-containing protein [Pigmentiphaga aceris]|uniref:DUF192 domain-containing protein n=1 Tax=Pigmentiphaga aceris TaxID=1940612 RepID=A0A5C0B119_9BURK|nr:DUF192 domain-containing protein [Pigmentiphaga aceris]QEI07574.1 DUF192 domain-containing protein [Pigmentiphaga aceris]
MTHYLKILHARTMWQRLVGLLVSGPLPIGSALRLSPCSAVHSIGMRHAIDVVFVDADNVVCAVRAPLRPWRAAVCLRAKAVLELRAGAVAAFGIRPGDKIEASENAAATDVGVTLTDQLRQP